MNNLFISKEKPNTKRSRISSLNNFVSFIVLSFILFEVFQGLFRWFLSLISWQELIYLIYFPKLALVSLIFVLPVIAPITNKKVALITALFALYTTWGIISLENPAQALFGLWVLAPFLSGLWFSKLVDVSQYKNLFVFLFFSASTLGGAAPFGQ